MENNNFLRYLPAWLRKPPNAGAFVAGSLTITAFMIRAFAFVLGVSGEITLLLAPIVIPFSLTGALALGLLTVALRQLFHWDLSAHPDLSGLLLFLLSLGGNMVVGWALVVVLTALWNIFCRAKH